MKGSRNTPFLAACEVTTAQSLFCPVQGEAEAIPELVYNDYSVELVLLCVRTVEMKLLF